MSLTLLMVWHLLFLQGYHWAEVGLQGSTTVPDLRSIRSGLPTWQLLRVTKVELHGWVWIAVCLFQVHTKALVELDLFVWVRVFLSRGLFSTVELDSLLRIHVYLFVNFYFPWGLSFGLFLKLLWFRYDLCLLLFLLSRNQLRLSLPDFEYFWS